MLDPKMPKLSQLPLGQRVGKSLRPLLTASKRNMSTGTFYKTMKAKIESDGVMTGKMAKATALRAAVGTDMGVSTKKEKVFVKEMGKADLLSNKYKDGSNYKLGMAVHDYHAAVSSNAPKTKTADSPSTAENEKIKRAKIRQADLHNKMQADHDARANGNSGANSSGVSLSGRDENVTTSISRVSRSVPKPDSEPIIQLD